jgi:hypothetical protein
MPKSKPQKKTKKAKARQPRSTSTPAADITALAQIANTLGFLALTTSDYKNKSDTEQIIFLANLGFDRNSIAAIVGTTPNTVSVRLSEAKATQPKKTT